MNLPADQLALWEPWRRRKLLIVGFERTGLSVARVLDRVGVRYAVSDRRPANELRPLLDGLEVERCDVHAGEQRSEQLEGIDALIVSPGVPRSIPLLQEASGRGIAAYGDVDFLYPFVAHKKLVGITGTDGKTTTTALAAAVLGRAGKVVVAGNIGVPIFSVYREILDSDYLVLELSSFMLEQIRALRTDVSCVLNIAQDHVDRYPDLDAYAAAKRNILQHARHNDVFVRNLDDPGLRSWRTPHVREVTISAAGLPADYTLRDGVFDIRGERLPADRCLLCGVQNGGNILAAAAIGCEAGLDPAVVADAIRRFEPLPHRFEDAGLHAGVRVINDSKATTVQAVRGALDNFSRGVVLIAGGRDKALDFTSLRACSARLKHVVCYGEAGPRIAQQLGSGETISRFEDAVERAAAVCEAGDILLLSPGCVSWDQFPSYEVRGSVFKHLAAGLLSVRGCSRLCVDSREVHPGAAFIAIEGTRDDGHRHVAEAVERGASVVFHAKGREVGAPEAVRRVAVEQPRELARLIAAPFHGHPSRRMKVIGITGTNGKTTTALLLERLLRGLGRNPGIIHTLGIRYAGSTTEHVNVVPEPVTLQRLLADMADQGVDTVILEVSSYALSIGRVHGVAFDTALVTNVTRDHLDVHGTMEQYVASKAKLAQSPGLRRLVVWSECAWREQLESAVGEAELVRFGMAPGGEVAAQNVVSHAGGAEFDVVWRGGKLRVHSPLIGVFNVLNVLGALACVMQEARAALPGTAALEAWIEEALSGLQVPGRLEGIENDRGACVFVDYAHTDDGLRNVLQSLRALPHGKLVVVFGCGGDRDAGKRPLMGRVAAELADRVILTSDNPRTEDPRELMGQIRAGMPAGADCIEVEDREQAIGLAVSELQAGDILLVAGKGHERTQVIGTQVRPFHDPDVIRRFCKQSREAM